MRRRKHDQALTLVEVLVVVCIIAILGAIGVAVSAPVRESARQAACGSQLRQLHAAVMQYTSDVDAQEEIPGLGPLASMGVYPKNLVAYGADNAVNYCPDFPDSLKDRVHRSYTWCPVPGYLFPNPDGGESGMLRKQAEAIARQGTSYPLFLCETHDEVFYQPREVEVDPFFAEGFYLEISVAGSLKSGRRPGPRPKLIEAASTVPEVRK